MLAYGEISPYIDIFSQCHSLVSKVVETSGFFGSSN